MSTLTVESQYSYHLFIIEWEALHGPECICGGANLLEDDKSLAAHLGRLQGHDIHDGPKLREESI